MWVGIVRYSDAVVTVIITPILQIAVVDTLYYSINLKK